MGQTPHRVVNPPALAPAVGFAHAVVAAPGRTVYLGGQTAHRRDGSLTARGVVDQYDLALANVVEALRAAGGRPEHLVSMTIYTTDVPAYRASLGELGAAHRRHLGRHYPATALFGVSELFDPLAVVEIVCTAVVPAPAAAPGAVPRMGADPADPADPAGPPDPADPADPAGPAGPGPAADPRTD